MIEFRKKLFFPSPKAKTRFGKFVVDTFYESLVVMTLVLGFPLVGLVIILFNDVQVKKNSYAIAGILLLVIPALILGLYSAFLCSKQKGLSLTTYIIWEKNFLISELPNLLQILVFSSIIAYYFHGGTRAAFFTWIICLIYLNNKRHSEIIKTTRDIDLARYTTWFFSGLLGLIIMLVSLAIVPLNN